MPEAPIWAPGGRGLGRPTGGPGPKSADFDRKIGPIFHKNRPIFAKKSQKNRTILPIFWPTLVGQNFDFFADQASSSVLDPELGLAPCLRPQFEALGCPWGTQVRP